MRKYVFTFVLILCLGRAYAQIDSNESKDHVIMKFLPLSLFDVDNTFQAGLEIPFRNRRFSVQQELGYGHSLFNVWYQGEQNHPNKNTIKSRTQFRVYFYERKQMRAYVAGEYLFKRVINKDNQWVGQDCIYGNCGYFESKSVRFGRFVNAGHMKAGWQFYFTNRITIDVYTGFGVRTIRGRTLTRNAENARLDDNWLIWQGGYRQNNGNYYQLFPSISPGFQIGFALGKFAAKSD